MRRANAAISILGLGLALLLAWAPLAGADTYTYTFNAADQLAGVQGPNGAASYTYDGDGQRITRATASGQTIYVRDPQGEVIAEYSGTGQLLVESVYVDGQRLCKITHDAQGVERRVYYHQDVVGTPVAETNESGQVLVRAQYYPFGEEVIPGAAPDPHKFTGKELDDESGLHYFGARYYDAHLGRFVSVDPIDGRTRQPQTWNRYAYSLNNPLARIDLDGRTDIQIAVVRTQSTSQYTTGRYSIVATSISGYTTEPPSNNNASFASSIPAGTYSATIGHMATANVDAPLLQDVPGRTDFFMHGGQDVTHTSGCILVGKTKVGTQDQLAGGPAARQEIVDYVNQVRAHDAQTGEPTTLTVTVTDPPPVPQTNNSGQPQPGAAGPQPT